MILNILRWSICIVELFARLSYLDNTWNENELDDHDTDENLSENLDLFHSVSLLQCFSHQSVHKNEPFDRRIRRRCSAARLRQKHGTELRSSEQGTRDLPKVGAHSRGILCTAEIRAASSLQKTQKGEHGKVHQLRNIHWIQNLDQNPRTSHRREAQMGTSRNAAQIEND